MSSSLMEFHVKIFFFTLAGALVETGTIAGIVSGLAMALIGAVSSYISYQQKKFCFSIQRKYLGCLLPPGIVHKLGC